jgi:hypothetical protein
LALLACAWGFVVFVARFPLLAVAFGLSTLGAIVASTAKFNGIGAAPISSAALRRPAAVVSPMVCDGLAATIVSTEVLDEPTSGEVEFAVSITSCLGLGGAAAAATSGVERITSGAVLAALVLSALMVGPSTGTVMTTGRPSDEVVGAATAVALALGSSITATTSLVSATTAGARCGRALRPEIWSGLVSLSERPAGVEFVDGLAAAVLVLGISTTGAPLLMRGVPVEAWTLFGSGRSVSAGLGGGDPRGGAPIDVFAI